MKRNPVWMGPYTLGAIGVMLAFFIGGVAVIAWGLPRQTFDLDVAIAVSPEQFEDLLRTLPARGFVVDDVFRKGFRDRVGEMEKIQVHLPAGRSLLALDVFFVTTPFLRSVLERRVATDLGQGKIFVCSAADLILFKLIANRRKDRVDIENVLTVQGVPEREYLSRWADTLGVRSRLDEELSRLG